MVQKALHSSSILNIISLAPQSTELEDMAQEIWLKEVVYHLKLDKLKYARKGNVEDLLLNTGAMCMQAPLVQMFIIWVAKHLLLLSV